MVKIPDIGVQLANFLERCLQLLFSMLAYGDVADVALDHVAVTGLIHIADKLHGNAATVSRFQRQVFITDITVLL